MSQEVVCPTCGGFIFSPDEEVMKLSPCTCIGPDSSSSTIGDSTFSVPVEASRPASGAMAALADVAAARPAKQASVAKVCCNCGKDVNGHRRMKDSRGRYWCYQCGKKDEKLRQEKELIGKEACRQCGTMVLVQDLQVYEGEFICPKCYREKKEDEKQTDNRIKRINTAFNKKNEMKRLLPLFIFLGILMLIVVLQMLHVIGGK